ncbi:alpha/beta hydrolase [Bradyrhizobium symbiodeficiens]|uniref:Alpha/beta hydrolase n=1 Tax=Bradyrhizobium symbiodeficiens TaxID=1404367 RepID=A0A6G8ZUV8_9BRAD|nr:alpha/beta hydrolase [Bradyrhizobium symbiodeficiens]QDF41392.1 alpha/beta hydrolase [Bradyrhizobium symbiodeficiens]QIP03869.1 alpha/beta hydrolase [Bradyrhizobium symbiodeficiens]QIP06465.1 alpha/beta hydrolase [Bradyrhizobium symbiodeficiens]
MSLDPLAKRLLTMMAAAAPQARGRPSVEARRQSLAKLMQFARVDAPDVTSRDSMLPGRAGELPYRLYTPANADERAPGFVFFHGGGLVAGGIATHDRIAAALAHATGCRLVSVDYRLAPEHKFPAAIDDAITATEWVAREAASLGIDADRLVVGGDSAGATLAAIVCQEAAQTAGLAIAAQCLICPVLDFEETSPSREAFAEGHLIDRVTIEADLSDYLPEGIDTADPRVSPLRATRLTGLPTAIIHTAEYDPMRDEGNAYARKLLAAGVAVEHVCHDGMVHNFHAMGAILPQAQLVLSQIGEQVRRAVAR